MQEISLRKLHFKRMNDLDNLPDYNLWSRGLKFDEVASLLKSLCENFEKDVDIFRIKIRMDKERERPMAMAWKLEIHLF